MQYVRFGGRTNGSPILNELRFEENILTLVPRLDDFLDAAVIQRWPVPVSTLQERMVHNYPRWAIRELMMNAIMHRDYQSNAPIRLYQYEDRIEIMNPGGLYGNARPENFPTVNDYRNPVIAEAMKVMDYVNMFSRGVGRVQEVLRENGNGEAIFELDKITVFNVVVKETPEDAAMTIAWASKKPVATVEKPVEKPVEKTVEKILVLLGSNPGITQRQLQAETGLTRRGVEWQLQQLKAAGRLKRVGPDKGGHWEVLT